MWWPWSKPEPPPKPTQRDIFNAMWAGARRKLSQSSVGSAEDAIVYLEDELGTLVSYPRFTTMLVCGSLGVFAGIALRKKLKYYFWKLKNADSVPSDWMKNGQEIKGEVTRVGDGDNFHVSHIPTVPLQKLLFWQQRPKTHAAHKGKTIHTRLAGIDAPEGSYWGKPAQPYAGESRAWLNNLLLGKTVWCKPHSRDRYRRIVASVYIRKPWVPVFLDKGVNVSLEMLREGWATVYEQQGAVYGDEGVDAFREAEASAKRLKKGIWANGELEETPAEYKKRMIREMGPVGQDNTKLKDDVLHM